MSDPSPRFRPSAPNSPGKMTRSEFDALSPHDKARAMREGWTVRDDPPGSERPVTISRAQYDRLPPVAQAEYTKRGGRVSDDLS